MESIDACIGLSQGDSCQFITPDGAVSGACAFVQGQLACVPAGTLLPYCPGSDRGVKGIRDWLFNCKDPPMFTLDVSPH